MKILTLSLKTKWFELSKARIKTEEYREITPYWAARLTSNDIDLTFKEIYDGLHDLYLGYSEDSVFNVHGLWLKQFDLNRMTLGYPKSGDRERTVDFKHLGITIGEGKPEWGAIPGEIYFVIKHGEVL